MALIKINWDRRDCQRADKDEVPPEASRLSYPRRTPASISDKETAAMYASASNLFPAEKSERTIDETLIPMQASWLLCFSPTKEAAHDEPYAQPEKKGKTKNNCVVKKMQANKIGHKGIKKVLELIFMSFSFFLCSL